MLEFLGVLSGVIIFLASIPYIIDIIKGNTKPQRMAWVIFITLSGISFFAQWAEGATNSLWLALVLFVQGIIIFVLTLKYGIGGYSKFDIASLIASILIIVLWVITDSAALAIICGVTINTIGKVLVAKKVNEHPNTEYLPTWVWSSIASFIAVISIGELDWILILAPLQNAVTVGLIAALIYFKRDSQVQEN